MSDRFTRSANVFNTARQAHTFLRNVRKSGEVVAKVGRKFVLVAPAFAKRMKLRIITG